MGMSMELALALAIQGVDSTEAGVADSRRSIPAGIDIRCSFVTNMLCRLQVLAMQLKLEGMRGIQLEAWGPDCHSPGHGRGIGCRCSILGKTW
ncbi:hypothetical protein BDV09DRAFT_167547 [Aspergillus tetrazonus]